MARFYVDLPIEIGTTIDLPVEVTRHIQVLRLKLNETIVLFNGDGYSYTANITTLERKNVSVSVINRQDTLPRHSHGGGNPEYETVPVINLGMCIIANDKMDLVISSATQLGVAKITPIISAYSQKVATDKVTNRLEHWRKISISSCEQSGRNILPIIDTPTPLADFVKTDAAATRLILSPYVKSSLAQTSMVNDTSSQASTLSLRAQHGNIPSHSLLVGPEGGFTATEIELAETHGYHPWQLGHNILRAETATLAAVSTILFGNK